MNIQDGLSSAARRSSTPTGTAGREDSFQERKREKERTKRSAGVIGCSVIASLGRFAELFEVQVAVVLLIFLDLMASTAQLLPAMQTSIAAAGSGAIGGNVGGEDSGSSTRGAWRELVLRLMQVSFLRLRETLQGGRGGPREVRFGFGKLQSRG